MPIYPAGRGKWRVRIWRQGRKKDWVIHGKKADARAFEARKRVELESRGPSERIRVAPTFSDFCVTRYRRMAEVELKSSTWKVRQYQLANLQEALGPLKLTEITNEALETYKQKRVRDGRKPTTVNNELAVLQAVLSHARHLGFPCSKPKFRFLTQRGARKQARVRVWSQEEVASLYAACSELSPVILPLVVFLANTGARKGEGLALRTENIDFGRRIVRIWPTDDWQPKDGDPREVPIGDALLPWLEGAAGDYAFPSPVTGTRWAYWPKRAFDRARREAGLEGGPHTLRHTFASHFLKTTPDLFLLARVMGHSDTRVTRLYSHLLPEHLERARNAVSFAPAVRPPGSRPRLRVVVGGR